MESRLVFGRASTERPFVTIAIPTYQRAGLLRQAVESALSQERYEGAYEVIVVDNDPAPESETARVMAQFQDSRLLYFRNAKNIGMFGNMNRCFELARGEWVALLHDDDLLKPGYLAEMLAHVRRRTGAGAIMANFEILDQRRTGPLLLNEAVATSAVNISSRGLMRIRPTQAIVFNQNVYGPPTCGSIFRRDLVLAAGGFNDDCPSADWFFIFRFNHDHPVYRTVGRLGYYRYVENDSLKFSTLLGFIEDAERFRGECARFTFLGKLVKKAFGPEQHLRMVKSVKGQLKSSSEFHSLGDIYPIVSRPGRMRLYLRVIALYKRVKNLEVRLLR